jgi:ribulose-5-phosphate 4-epimerase/fuculose-1-phosphate aldolase
MTELEIAIRDVVIANRILANENVTDGYGHISVRHPHDPNRYLLSCSRSPEFVDNADILEHELDGTVVNARGREPYIERFIHGAIYEARPDIQAVVHSHANEVLPFSITATPLRPVIITASTMGTHVPVWDSRDEFSDSNMLVSNMAMGRSLASRLGSNRVALMRGHGFAATGRTLKELVKLSVYIPQNAKVLEKALRWGEVKGLSDQEIEKRLTAKETPDLRRVWEYWARRAGCGELFGS